MIEGIEMQRSIQYVYGTYNACMVNVFEYLLLRF